MVSKLIKLMAMSKKSRLVNLKFKRRKKKSNKKMEIKTYPQFVNTDPDLEIIHLVTVIPATKKTILLHAETVEIETDLIRRTNMIKRKRTRRTKKIEVIRKKIRKTKRTRRRRIRRTLFHQKPLLPMLLLVMEIKPMLRKRMRKLNLVKSKNES